MEMDLLIFIFLAVIPVKSDGFTVRGPSAPLVAPLGSSVVLPCYVDNNNPLPMNDLEVEWRRTYLEALVHLYQDGQIRPEAQQQDYHDRAHFFTDEIQHGNFSLRLDNLRAEDEGEYRCTVYSQQDSGETVVQIKDVERLLVSGSDDSVSAFVGEDVTLNCSVDSHIKPEHIEEVSWKKTHEDGDYLVLLFQNNEILAEAVHEQYRGRVEFFTAEIPRGNFSLRLKSVRTEDKGVYMCQVFAGHLSANATVVLERMGFSTLHIIMLILCISASGSALLLCLLIYCRTTTKGFKLSDPFNNRFVPLGGSVVLPCKVKKSLLKKSLKVEWRRADSDTLVHLYQNGRAMKRHKDYHHRAHFRKKEIKEGYFSLCLEKVRAEDAGKYTCKVYSDQDCVHSAEAEVVILGFKVEHTFDTVAPLGSSVVLPCYREKPSSVEGLKVEWRRTDSDLDSDLCSQKTVHLYKDGESQADEQHENDHDRAHLFTDEIQHGNFSLRLDDLRTEDKGEYTCTVYRNQTLVFSVKKKIILRLLETIFHLQMFLIFFPNILMFLAFLLWGFSEGSLNESVSCGALYFLRPLLLLWAAPYIKEFKGKIYTWILKYSYVGEYVLLSVVVYSALLVSAWQRIMNYAEFERVVIIVLFVIVFLPCFCKVIHFLVTEVGKKSGRIIDIFDVVTVMIFEILPTLQFVLLFYTFGSARGGIIIIVILPVLLMMMNDRMFYICYDRLGCSYSAMRTVMIVFTIVMNAVMIGFYIFTLDNKTDAVGMGCVLVFLQILWIVMKFTDDYMSYYIRFSREFPRVDPVYVFGSVVVVLLNSATLMTELILKTVTGDRTVDLRFIVFPSECLFAVFLLISAFFPSKIKKFLQFCQNSVKCKKCPARRSQENQGPVEATELNPLKTEDQKKNQPESVESQP